MRIMGLDYGQKNIGVALSSEDHTIAFPHLVVPCDGEEYATLAQIAKQEGVKTIIVGDPGEHNSLYSLVKEFGDRLTGLGYTIVFEKEFMTSLHSDMFTKEKPIARKTKQPRERKKDESAAALILQRYLDKQRHD